MSNVDCVLLAGDVFETLAPTGDAERVVCDALAEFAAAGNTTVVVGGNHDHPRRLAALRKLGNPLRILVRLDPARPGDGGVILLQKGNEKAHIAVLPWVREYPGRAPVRFRRRDEAAANGRFTYRIRLLLSRDSCRKTRST